VGSRGEPQAPTPAPPAEPDHLTLTAECLEKGDHAGAATHLEAYVRRHPDQFMFRAQLAELLVRLGKDDAAKAEFEAFAADAAKAPGARNQLVHAHTRLMEIAQRAGDRFAEAYHRGAGLLLLVKQLEKAGDPDEGFREEVLCKALRALQEARELDPADMPARLRLAEVFDRTHNRRAADAERAATDVLRLPHEPRP
jgi:thioredoxin-like negative regulator of GroEL